MFAILYVTFKINTSNTADAEIEVRRLPVKKNSMV
jgi:hypothetical protein